MNFDVVIVGGGASGLVAAITAARRNKSVLLLEHKDKLAKKILATGNGKCNFSNTYYDESVYRSDNPSFVLPVINQFTVEKTITFFEELGIYPMDKGGYLYPNSGQAASILEVLQLEVNRLGVHIVYEEHVIQVVKKKKAFEIITDKNKYYGKTTILSTGGKASDKLGSDGSGYALAKSLGHTIVPVVQALTALKSNLKVFKAISGVRTNVELELFTDGTSVASEVGELQLTDYGVSGIPVFQISRYATKALYEKKKVELMIDFLPQFSFQEAMSFFEQRAKRNGEKTLEEFMVGILNSKLNSAFLKEAQFSSTMPVKQLKKQELRALISVMKQFLVPITEGNPFANSQVCAGGVNTREIHPETMESKLVPGLFFTGELVDVDGTCGGYNLQWAWSSGYVAGSYCGE